MPMSVVFYNQIRRALLLGSSFIYLFLSCGSEQKHDPDAAENRLAPRVERVYPTSIEVSHPDAKDLEQDQLVDDDPGALAEEPVKEVVEEQEKKSWFSPVVDPIKKILPKKEKAPGQVFVDAYKADYSQITKKVNAFYAQGSKWGCAAYASTALKQFKLPIKQVLVTNELEQQFLALGYKKVNLSLLKPGDVVFTTKADSNLKGTYSHVFVHGGYTGPLRRESLATDNYTSEYVRTLGGNKTYSKAVVAYRPAY